MAITTQALRVQILTSAPSLAFSMFLSFRVLYVKSGGGPLNRANHPGIQSLNDRCLGSLGVHPRECLGLRRRATASSAFSWRFRPARNSPLELLLRSSCRSVTVC